MAGLDVPFTAITIDADESYPASLQAGDIPYYISRAKARAYEDQLQPDQLLITADTIVWLDGRMLGKPHDETEAISMLRDLSGQTHQVYTAVTFARLDVSTSRHLDISTIVDKTDVTFAELSE
jgi:septum formation protein